MGVLFYKRVCHTHTCVNTVRTLPLNILVLLKELQGSPRKSPKTLVPWQRLAKRYLVASNGGGTSKFVHQIQSNIATNLFLISLS